MLPLLALNPTFLSISNFHLLSTQVFSATRFEGSRHVVISPRGPPNHAPLLMQRKARHSAEFNLSGTIFLYDAPTPSTVGPRTPANTLRRLEIYRQIGANKGYQGFGPGRVSFEPGAILAATHYLCAYVERNPYGSNLPRGASDPEGTQQRLAFYLPDLHEQQRAIGVPDPDGVVRVMFNAYRQVAAIAVPSISSLFKVHSQGVPLKHIIDTTQPHVKITPDYVRLQKDAQCPVVSLGRDLHFILIDITDAPAILPAVVVATGTSKSLAHTLDELSIIDEGNGWNKTSLQKGLVCLVWFIRGSKDTVQGEATIENARCRVFGDYGAFEEEGLGSAAAALGGWLSLYGEDGDARGGANEGRNVAESLENLGLDVKDKGDSMGADITPTQSHESSKAPASAQAIEKAEDKTTAAPSQTQAQKQTQRKVFGITMAQELDRNSTVAVEVDVLQQMTEGKVQRSLAGMVVSGRANFETEGKLLGA